MENEFEWKAEIQFKGTADEFNQLMQSVEKLHVVIDIPEWILRPHHLAGCMPVPIDVLLGEERVAQIIKDMPRMRLNYIRDIRGGIRTPHLHLGNDVVLLDRARFKTVVGQVAQELATRRVEQIADYAQVMAQVGQLADSPLPILNQTAR
jgi:hypothetical protein